MRLLVMSLSTTRVFVLLVERLFLFVFEQFLSEWEQLFCSCVLINKPICKKQSFGSSFVARSVARSTEPNARGLGGRGSPPMKKRSGP